MRQSSYVVGMVGVEPTREVIPKVFETFASADSATSPSPDRKRSARLTSEDDSLPERETSTSGASPPALLARFPGDFESPRNHPVLELVQGLVAPRFGNSFVLGADFVDQCPAWRNAMGGDLMSEVLPHEAVPPAVGEVDNQSDQ